MDRKYKLILISVLLLAVRPVTAQNITLVKPGADRIEFSPMIFGQFIEHFDRQVYGGIFCPGNPLSDEDGFRTDVIEAMKELKVPIVRWPGGCFVSSYHWYYGVGPDRQPVFDKAWQVEDPNTFGTDEFVKWCRKIGCEPFICTNAGTGTMEEMSDWVEYCNLNVGKFGRQRIANGYPEPHDVRYWSIGNENWGGHELGAKSVQEWGPLVRESAKLMLSADKDLKLFAAALPDKDWTLPLIRTAGNFLDYVSIHGYWDFLAHNDNPSPYLTCMMRTDGPENEILNTIGILQEAGFGDGKIKIAFDEWNLRGWHHPWHGNFRKGFDIEARKRNDRAATYTMADAVFASCFLNACLRHSDIVEIACFSPIVNARGALYVYPEGLVKRTTFHVLSMYANHLLPVVVPTENKVESLTDGEDSTEVLDIVLTSDREGKSFVYAVANKDPQREQALTLDFKGLGKSIPGKVKVKVLSGNSTDDYNDIDAERVKPCDDTLQVRNGKVSLPPHSVVFIFID